MDVQLAVLHRHINPCQPQATFQKIRTVGHPVRQALPNTPQGMVGLDRRSLTEALRGFSLHAAG